MSNPSDSPQPGRLGRIFALRLVRYPIYGLLGVVAFAIIVGGFTETVEATNTLEFCISCHDMRNNYEEYKKTVHYSNRAGVRAVCSDCHVPKRGWFTEMRRKLIAARDVWAEIVGEIDTQEKFDAKRAEMAKREWARMKESDSITCRNCHALESMDLAAQDKGARNKHTRAAMSDSDKTCIDCHKGIAHKLPKVQSEES
jgi:cytochrome c-type protein NapC